MTKVSKKAQLVDVMPSDLELERVVLGSILLEKSGFERVSDILNEADFYLSDHGNVYGAMVSLSRENQPIDLFSVLKKMASMGTSHKDFGAFHLTGLTNKVTSTANLENHAMMLAELSKRRSLYRICMNDAAKAINPEQDVWDVMQQHDGSITGLMNSGISSNLSSVETVVGDALSRIEMLRTKESHITGIPSGFRELDRITHGWQNTDLIVLAARPAMGKTALALRFAKNAIVNSLSPTCAAFFSLEMSKGQLMNRLLSAESEVHLGNFISGRMTNDQMDQVVSAAKRVSGWKFFIDDTPGLGIMELKSKARRLKRKHNLGILIVDYIQLITDHSKNNREQEISSISRQLKSLAKELDIPVIALCQLSREVEKRSNKAPQLSDLRESGAIEQDADMVMFLYRPEYYGVNATDMGDSTADLCEVNIAKHRNGELEKVQLRSNLGIQSFYDWNGPSSKSPGPSFIPVQLANQEQLPF